MSEPPRSGAPADLTGAAHPYPHHWGLLAVILGLGATPWAGCGYTAGSGLRSEGIRTVAVDVVGNQTFRQGLEQGITREVYNNLVLSDVRLAPRDQADAILRATLIDDAGQVLVAGGGLPLLEGSLNLRLRVELLDARTGRVLRQGVVDDAVEFRLPVGESLSGVAVELNRDLGRKIVLFLESSF